MATKAATCGRGCRLLVKSEVNLGRIRRNVIEIKSETKTRFMLMVKANAYAHGLKEVAQSTEDIVDAFGVATLEEGIALRCIGVKKEVLVTMLAPQEIASAFKWRLSVGVSSFQMLASAVEEAQKGNAGAVHIALDTGMHRMGFEPNDVNRMLKMCQDGALNVVGCYTHFGNSERKHQKAFAETSKRVLDVYPSAVAHCASSAYLQDKTLRYDMVRVGYAAYSGAMIVRGTVIAARRVCKGECVGYGTYVMTKDTNVAVVFGGYADGFKRECCRKAYIGAVQCVQIGVACMDATLFDTGDYKARIGDEVLLLGSQYGLDEFAKDCATSPYVAVSALHGRVQHRYISN